MKMTPELKVCQTIFKLHTLSVDGKYISVTEAPLKLHLHLLWEDLRFIFYILNSTVLLWQHVYMKCFTLHKHRTLFDTVIESITDLNLALSRAHTSTEAKKSPLIQSSLITIGTS